MKQQHTPLRYAPNFGSELKGAWTAERWRKEAVVSGGVSALWLFNPWTGRARNTSDIASDPEGLLILPPGEPLFASSTGAMTRTYHQDGTQPTNGEVFVFGSNMRGHHAGGAARAAAEHFGAEDSVYIGRSGQSFAVPTADANGSPLPLHDINQAVSIFLHYAATHPEDRFFVTRIGCGIVGYEDRQIAPLFRDAPRNISFPEQWKEWVE